MAGGTWEAQNKVRPGAYINFRSEGVQGIEFGERGTVALPLVLPWGQEQEVLTINSADINSLFPLLGFALVDPELLLLKETFKGARTVLLYRVNSGTKATATIGEQLTVTARYSGTRGNDITIVVQQNIVDETKYDVKTLIDGREHDVQVAGDIEELEDNDFVQFGGSGSFTATAGTALEGGANGDATSVEYAEFLSKVEAYSMNVICYPGTDEGIKELFKNFTIRLRDEEGIKIQCVLEDVQADYEGSISVLNGVILNDGTELAAEKAVAFVAGASAGSRINQSLTYSRYPGAVGVNERLSHSEIVSALQDGQIVFVPRDNGVVIEQDINTLVTFTPEKNKIFSKNRPLRTLDQLNNDVRRLIEDRYLGKVSNNEEGRSLVKNDILKQLQVYEALSALTNVRQEDVEVSIGNEIDAVVATIAAQPVDSMEKFYIEVVVR